MPHIDNRLKKIQTTLRGALKTPRGKDIATYLVFVVVAFVFWLLLSLDSEIQRDYDIPLEIENMPDSVTMISSVPPSINVSVQAKGASLIQYNWGKIPTFRLNFHEFITDENTWSVPAAKMESKIRDYFGSGTMINSIRPDSLKLIYTTLPGEKIPLKVDLDATPNIQCIISGPVTANVDSVMAYSPTGTTRLPHVIETERVVRRNLKDTTIVEVRLRHIAGVRLIPDRVTLKIPVEPLISKKQIVGIEPLNLPSDRDLITFPSKTEVTYLVPMSRYGDDIDIRVAIDYTRIRTRRPKAPLTVVEMPDFVHSITLSPDSVEYVIENNE